MAQFNSVLPTTELEAVNAILSAAGLAPVDQTELDTPTLDDTINAISTFQRLLREAQTKGWTFNYRYGLQLSPSGTYDWTDANGQVTTLNVFKRPAAALSFSVTPSAQNGDLDLVEAISFRYTESSAAVLILIDRARNRDGADSARYPFIYIDGAFACDFDRCPESFRAYCVAAASRRFVFSTLGQDAARSLEKDEAILLNLLNKDQGLRVSYNMFDSADAQEMLGRRPYCYGGMSRRVYPQ